MGEFSLTHWLILLAILLLFFGPSKLPGLGASLGKAIRGFKAGLHEADPNTPPTDAANTTQPNRPEQLQQGPQGSGQGQQSTTNVNTKEPQNKS